MTSGDLQTATPPSFLYCVPTQTLPNMFSNPDCGYGHGEMFCVLGPRIEWVDSGPTALVGHETVFDHREGAKARADRHVRTFFVVLATMPICPKHKHPGISLLGFACRQPLCFRMAVPRRGRIAALMLKFVWLCGLVKQIGVYMKM